MGSVPRWRRCGREMRGLLLCSMLALAIVAGAETILEEEEEMDLLQIDDVRVGRMLQELFEFNDEDDLEHDLELGIAREPRAKTEEASEMESKAVVAPEDQARYNKFMDTFYRRLNADARSTFDPLEVPITPRKKGRKNKTKKGGNKSGSKNTEEKKDGDKKKNKKNQKKGNKKANNKKNKKTARHPKSLNVNGVEDDTENEEVAVAEEVEEEGHHIVAREAAEETELVVREENEEDE